MTFVDALNSAKSGNVITRPEWNRGKVTFDNTEQKYKCSKTVTIKAAYTPTPSDMTATDWIVTD